MRTSKLAVVAILPAAALSVNAEVRMESATSEFTYEAVGATPSLHFGRAITKAAKAPQAAETPKAAETQKAAGAAKPAIARTTTRAENEGASRVTYDAFGATVSASEEGAGQQASVPPDDAP